MRHYTLLGSVAAGMVTGLYAPEWALSVADIVATMITRLFQLVSIPLLFLSLVSSITGMSSLQEAFMLGSRALKYTVLTTVLSASVGLVLVLLFSDQLSLSSFSSSVTVETVGGYKDMLIACIPHNIVSVFSGDGSLFALVILALLVSGAALQLADKERALFHKGIQVVFALFLKLTKLIISLLPLGIWSFVTLLVVHMADNHGVLRPLLWYVGIIVSANILHGVIVLPLLVRWYNIAPFSLFTAFRPALSLAFFSKSSTTTLPLTLSCARHNAGLRERVCNFILPLCATINMNGCATFILVTMLFVRSQYGVPITVGQGMVWLLVALVAAIGNAGVPMGCFFLTSALLSALHLPLTLMGMILPFYTLIDMVETALNVWSDACVAALVDREYSASLSEPEYATKE